MFSNGISISAEHPANIQKSFYPQLLDVFDKFVKGRSIMTTPCHSSLFLAIGKLLLLKLWHEPAFRPSPAPTRLPRANLQAFQTLTKANPCNEILQHSVQVLDSWGYNFQPVHLPCGGAGCQFTRSSLPSSDSLSDSSCQPSAWSVHDYFSGDIVLRPSYNSRHEGDIDCIRTSLR